MDEARFNRTAGLVESLLDSANKKISEMSPPVSLRKILSEWDLLDQSKQSGGAH